MKHTQFERDVNDEIAELGLNSRAAAAFRDAVDQALDEFNERSVSVLLDREYAMEAIADEVRRVERGDYAIWESERERGEDDGVEYGHPGDRLRGIE